MCGISIFSCYKLTNEKVYCFYGSDYFLDIAGLPAELAHSFSCRVQLPGFANVVAVTNRRCRCRFLQFFPSITFVFFCRGMYIDTAILIDEWKSETSNDNTTNSSDRSIGWLYVLCVSTKTGAPTQHKYISIKKLCFSISYAHTT
jgi:hypothetical protein